MKYYHGPIYKDEEENLYACKIGIDNHKRTLKWIVFGLTENSCLNAAQVQIKLYEALRPDTLTVISPNTFLHGLDG